VSFTENDFLLSSFKGGTALIDLDGTLIKQDLEKEFVSYLKNSGELDLRNYLAAIITIPVNRLMRVFGNRDLFRAWSLFRSNKQLDTLIEQFLMQERKVELRKSVLDLIDEFEGDVVLITGCNEHLATKFLYALGIFEKFKTIHGSSTFGSGFLLKHHPYGKSKVKYLDAYTQPFFSIGDSYADRYLFFQSSFAIVVQPSNRLRILARKMSWTILESP
jgi:phosphoserine phosphatase